MNKNISLYQQVSLQFQPLGQIEALLLTTFCLDVGYLEKSILPAFFPNLGEGPTTEPHRPLFEYLEENTTPISIMYDANNLLRGETKIASGGSVLKELRWQAHPVTPRSGCFHPKLIIALTRKEQQQYLVLACSSANLTRSGWGQNFEACAMEVIELRSGMKSSLVVDVQKLLKCLKEKSGAAGPVAMQRILESLKSISPRPYPNRRYRQSYRSRLWFGQGGKNLLDWLRDEVIKGELGTNDPKWSMEVLSPYYSDAPPKLIKWVSECFLEQEANTETARILFYCPKDGEVVNVAPEAVKAFDLVPLATWAEFRVDRLRSQLRDQEGSHLQRFLHAKVYRFWNPNCEILVVGSANATIQGHRDKSGNDEACLVFSREAKEGAQPFEAWLQPLQSPPEISQCKEKIELEDTAAVFPVPNISIEFDWASKEFRVQSRDKRALSIHIGASPEPQIKLSPKAAKTLKPDDRLTQALFVSPSVKVALGDAGDDSAWLCLVEEHNLHSKPPAPSMERSIDDLILDWQLGTEQRQANHIARAAMPDDLRASSSGDSPELEEGGEQDRLNDLFMAMYRFRTEIGNKLSKSVKLDSFSRTQIQSRLFGRGAMSVRYMVSKLCPSEYSRQMAKVPLAPLEQYLGVMSLIDAVERLRKPLIEAGMEEKLAELLEELKQAFRKTEERLRPLLEEDSSTVGADDLMAWAKTHFSYDLARGELNHD